MASGPMAGLSLLGGMEGPLSNGCAVCENVDGEVAYCC